MGIQSINFASFKAAAGGGASTIQNEPFTGAINTALWDATTPGVPFTYDANVTAVQSGGVLTITPRSSHASAAYNGFTSDSTYDFTDSYIIVEVPTVLSGTAAGIDHRFLVYADSNNYIHFNIGGNGTQQILGMRIRVGGSNSEPGIATVYNSTNHRWWRIRHQTSGGHIYWDTAPDGSTWTNLRDYTSTLPTLTSMKVALVAGTFASIASPGTAVFDNLSSDL